MHKPRILFLLPSLHGGGAERVISNLLLYLDPSKYSVSLALVKKEGVFLNNIPASVEIIDLNASKSRYAVLKIIYLIYSKKPNVVFSTMSHLNLLIAIVRPILSKRIKFIARESSIVSIRNDHIKYKYLFNFLYVKYYNNFDLIVCQSYLMKKDLIKNYGLNYERITVINNPVVFSHINGSLSNNHIYYNTNIINLLSVGRLSHSKGFEFLLNTMNKLDDNYHLTILGDGEDKEKLVSLVKKLKIDNRVTFLGFQDNPYEFMHQADLFILSSMYEGFPNVVLEANACGTPVIAFNCPGSSVNEIIKDGVNGFLVDCGNIHKLAKKITEATKYNWNREEIISLANKRYNIKKIIKQYETILC